MQSSVIATHEGVYEIIRYLFITASLLFFAITNRDCVALPYINISMLTSTSPMDEVVVACPSAHNNNDARSRAIYVRVITNLGGGTTYAYSSLSSKLMVQVSVIRHTSSMLHHYR
jgi:hypothetical protein